MGDEEIKYDPVKELEEFKKEDASDCVFEIPVGIYFIKIYSF